MLRGKKKKRRNTEACIHHLSNVFFSLNLTSLCSNKLLILHQRVSLGITSTNLPISSYNLIIFLCSRIVPVLPILLSLFLACLFCFPHVTFLINVVCLKSGRLLVLSMLFSSLSLFLKHVFSAYELHLCRSSVLNVARRWALPEIFLTQCVCFICLWSLFQLTSTLEGNVHFLLESV